MAKKLTSQVLNRMIMEAIEEGGVESLFDKSRREPNYKNRVDDLTENAVKDYAIECPAHGQLRVSNELRHKVYWMLSFAAESPAAGLTCVNSQISSFSRKIKSFTLNMPALQAPEPES